MPLRIHDERLTMRVGAGVLVGFVATVIGVTTVRFGGGGVEIRVHFGAAGALREGAAVMVAGQDVGHVARVQLDDRGGVVAIADIDPDWARRIPVNSEIFMGARSVLAPRYLEIGAPPRHAVPDRPLRTGDELIGVDPPDLDRLVQRIWDDLGEAQAFMDAIAPATARLRASMAHLDLPEIDLPPLPEVPSLGDLVDHARAFADRAEATFAALRADLQALRVPALRDPALARVIDQTDHAVAAAQTLLADARAVMSQATEGDGAIASLLADDELVDQVKDLTKQLKRHPWRVLAR